jgi:hypothetical protein
VRLVTEKKLPLGSGADYKAGWINLDLGSTNIYGKGIKVDVIHDLNNYVQYLIQGLVSSPRLYSWIKN